MEKICEYIFTEQLNVEPNIHNVLLTEASFGHKYNKEEMAQIMLEIFNVHGLYFSNPSILSLFNIGKLICIKGGLWKVITQVF